MKIILDFLQVAHRNLNTVFAKTDHNVLFGVWCLHIIHATQGEYFQKNRINLQKMVSQIFAYEISQSFFSR